ncbi:MAG: HAMP domain-containing sensor histidine kinase [Planctomycetota bacterium]
MRRALAPVFRSIGLGGKLMLATTGVLLLTVSLCGFGIRWEAGRQLDAMLAHQARQSAEAVALAVSEPLAAGDVDRINDILHSASAPAGVGFIRLIDSNNRPVASASVADYENVVHGTSVVLLPDRGETSPMGTITVGLDTAGHDAALEKIEARLIVLGLACCALGQVLISLFVRQTSRPLAAFERASRKIAQGESVDTFDLRRTDILGDLGRSFQHMADEIERQRQSVQRVNSELAQVNRELETRIAHRTTQLETANGRLAGEIAEKEDFLRAISHDLNAPLRNIAGMVTMLRRKAGDTLSDDTLHRLDRIEKNVEHEMDLINELLELSRIKTRQTDFAEMELVNLEQMVWDLRGMFESDLREKHIEVSLATALPKVRCERPRIRQVLQNLIDNAIKYMGDGSLDDNGVVHKTISVGCVVRPNEAEFFVRDTGKGIAAEDIDKVFYVFRRASNHGDAQGKGVGLASVKSIVETYNGTIWAESELGKGTTFRFTINAKYVEAGLAKQPTSDAAPINPASVSADAA